MSAQLLTPGQYTGHAVTFSSGRRVFVQNPGHAAGRFAAQLDDAGEPFRVLRFTDNGWQRATHGELARAYVEEVTGAAETLAMDYGRFAT